MNFRYYKLQEIAINKTICVGMCGKAGYSVRRNTYSAVLLALRNVTGHIKPRIKSQSGLWRIEALQSIAIFEINLNII